MGNEMTRAQQRRVIEESAQTQAQILHEIQRLHVASLEQTNTSLQSNTGNAQPVSVPPQSPIRPAPSRPARPNPPFVSVNAPPQRTATAGVPTSNRFGPPFGQASSTNPFAQNEPARNQAQRPSVSPHIYPSLGQLRTPPGARPSTPQPQTSNARTSAQSRNHEQFVFVDKPRNANLNHGAISKLVQPSAPALVKINNSNNNREPQDPTEASLKCPTCNQQFTADIFQCGGGHSACATCKHRNRTCALCAQPLTDMRNFALQAYMAELKMPCPNAPFGCKLSIKIQEKDGHLRECAFGDVVCPSKDVIGGCHWSGKLGKLAEHFQFAHPNWCATVDREMSLPSIYFNLYSLCLVTMGVYNFIVHIKVSEENRTFSLAVQLMGTKSSAQKWLYEVHVYNKREPRRKYSYSEGCYATGEQMASVLDSGACATLPLPYAAGFLDAGSITYKFFIKKRFEDKGRENGGRPNNWRKRNNNNNN